MTTREQIIAAGFEHFEQFPDDYKQKLVALFEAGRVAEREECAKVCESLPSLWPTERVIADECSSAIRARSTK